MTGRRRTNVTDDFGVGIIRILQQYGHNTVGAENILFGVDKSSKARLLLGGTVTEIDCTTFSAAKEVTCDCAVEWEVFDTASKTVTYKALTRFRRAWGKHVKLAGDEGHILVVGALASLMSRPKFVDALRKKEPTPAGTAAAPSTYRSCGPRDLSLPTPSFRTLTRST